MLEYENHMFLEILHEDGLVVTAKGLGLETVFLNILRAYQDPGNLVIVLGTTDHEEQYFIEKLKSLGLTNLPMVINSQCSSNEREIKYLEGGIFFISGRILVVDLLKNRIPLKLVTGILIYRAHNILNSYQESFALRLYRQTNKTGFIKAFTNSALAFTVGYARVERVMKTLFVKKLYLWPRFHTIVNNSLSEHKPEVIELHVKITRNMVNIQTALLDVMNYLVKELKRINKHLDLDELTVENAIAKKFHKQLQLQLDPIWNQLSFSTKQLIADLKKLRSLLLCLTYEDSVSFYAMLNSLRTMEYAMNSSGWLMLDTVENLFKYAKDRVYNQNNELKPETNPKWEALKEVISEIQKQKITEENPEKILILVHNKNTCRQLKNLLIKGSKEYLIQEARRKLRNDINTVKNRDEKNHDTEETSEITVEEENCEEFQDSCVLVLSQKSPAKDEQSEEEFQDNTFFEEFSQNVETEMSSSSSPLPVITIQSLKTDGNPFTLKYALEEQKPSCVIMYVADISAVRQLEVYQSNNPSIKLKVYFLIYGGSVEEQEYLTSLRREKEAFKILINTKTTMVIPEDQDGKSDECLALTIESDVHENEENTRKAGGQPVEKKVIQKVIVDIREFRSELPGLLHKRGIEIEPVTLIVGDYILSPEICVERKNISDLIGSLNNGRLYNQAVSMTRHYAKPMLLIEFDQNKPFGLQGNYYISKDMKSTLVTAKLQLLTLHFPKLKLVWSPNPAATAQLFEELKQGREQPDASKAAQIGIEENADDSTVMEATYNVKIQDLIAKLPGVHTKNLRIILNQGKSLPHLIKLTKEEITTILGNKNDGEMLYNALHENLAPTENESANVRKSFTRGRGKRLFSRVKNK